MTDIQLHYVEQGHGRPMVLLHGNGEDSSYFVNQIAHFSKSYRVIAVDTRGHGQSPRGEKPFSIKQFSEDLKDFLDSVEVAKAKKNAEMLGLMVNEPHIDPSELASLTMPVLVVAGTKDMIKESHTKLIYNNLPNAQLAIVEGDHFVANKNPEAFNTIVESFLAS